MIAPMATTRRYLSSLSLALSASTNDPFRDALQATLHHFSRDVTLATVLVAIGVALEGVELIHAASSWLKRIERRRRDRIELAELAEFFPTSDIRGEAASPHYVKSAGGLCWTNAI